MLACCQTYARNVHTLQNFMVKTKQVALAVLHRTLACSTPTCSPSTRTAGRSQTPTSLPPQWHHQKLTIWGNLILANFTDSNKFLNCLGIIKRCSLYQWITYHHPRNTPIFHSQWVLLQMISLVHSAACCRWCSPQRVRTPPAGSKCWWEVTCERAAKVVAFSYSPWQSPVWEDNNRL